MNHCQFCNIPVADETRNLLEYKKHHTSFTHLTNEYRTHLLSRKNKEETNQEEWQTREASIQDYKDLVEMEDLNCPNCPFHCDEAETMLKHEEECMGLRVVVKEEEVYPFIKCNDCGQKFFDRGQKMKPKYLLNRHKKNCARTMVKNGKKRLKSWLDSNDNVNILKKMLLLIDNDE